MKTETETNPETRTVMVRCIVSVTVPVGTDDVDPEEFGDLTPEQWAIEAVKAAGRLRTFWGAERIPQTFTDGDRDFDVEIDDVFGDGEFERDWDYRPPQQFITGPDGRAMRNPALDVFPEVER
jgi:hypothetical protein